MQASSLCGSPLQSRLQGATRAKCPAHRVERVVRVLVQQILFEVCQVVEVFVAARSPFIRLQIFQPNEGDGDLIYFYDLAIGVSGVKCDTVDACQDVDPVRRISHLYDLLRPGEILNLKTKRSQAKILKYTHQFFPVGNIRPDPKVYVACVPWVAIDCHSISSRNQIADLMPIQQFYKLSEVLAQCL